MKLMKSNNGRRSLECLFTPEIYGRQLPTVFLYIIVLLATTERPCARRNPADHRFNPRVSVPLAKCMSVRVCEFEGYDYDKFINTYLDEEDQGNDVDPGDKPAELPAIAMTSVCFSPHPSCYLTQLVWLLLPLHLPILKGHF